MADTQARGKHALTIGTEQREMVDNGHVSVGHLQPDAEWDMNRLTYRS